MDDAHALLDQLLASRGGANEAGDVPGDADRPAEYSDDAFASRFTPAFKLMIAGNHKPSLRSVDEAVKRRFNLLPFTVTIPKAERDPSLPEKLKAEWPGILAWAIEGCLEWQAMGLNPPPAVQSATASYLADEDTIGLFLAERGSTDDPDAATEVKDLFASWSEWSSAAGEFTGSIKRFSSTMRPA